MKEKFLISHVFLMCCMHLILLNGYLRFHFFAKALLLVLEWKSIITSLPSRKSGLIGP